MDLVILRASDIPRIVLDKRSITKAGISGGDIFWEAGLGQEAGEKLPVKEFVPDAKTSRLFIGVTEKFAKKIATVSVSSLTGQMIVTKYPNIAQEILDERGVERYTLFSAAGKTEGMQYAYPDCYGIVDVTSTESTVKANNIIVLERFYTSTVRMIEAADKITSRDRAILDDFRDRIAIALQKRRMIE